MVSIEDEIIPEEIVVLDDDDADGLFADPPLANLSSAPDVGGTSTSGGVLSESLRDLIEGLNLGNAGTAEALRAASDFIDEQGYDCIAELHEVGATDELVARLELKPGKARLLSKRLADQHQGSGSRMAVPVGEPVLPLADGRPEQAAVGAAWHPVPTGSWRGSTDDLALAYTRAQMKLEARAAAGDSVAT